LESFAWFAVGLGVLLVALALILVLLRLNRALAVLEETLLTADEAIREVVPEVRHSLGNVNDITAGVNIALRSAGSGANRLSRDASAALYGARVAAGTLWRTFAGSAGPDGGRRNGK
jgi:hypothetical protein